ncbi:hypothetical protein KRMM14A1259_57230 [Krasilnikovia sp. MM14-A1259]
MQLTRRLALVFAAAVAATPLAVLTGGVAAEAGATPGATGLAAAKFSKCVETQGASRAHNAQVQIFKCSYKIHQKWVFVKLSDGTYHIINDKSDLCMNVKGGSKANSAKVVQFPCQGVATSDRWRMVKGHFYENGVKHERGDFQLVNVGSGKCLNVQGGSGRDGTDLIQFTCSKIPDVGYPKDTNDMFAFSTGQGPVLA